MDQAWTVIAWVVGGAAVCLALLALLLVIGGARLSSRSDD